MFDLLLPALLMGSWIASVVLYYRHRSFLRGAIAGLYTAVFFIGFLQMFTLAPLFVRGDLYDHGMPGEYSVMAALIACWALSVITGSILLARKDSSLSIVFPVIYLLTAVLVMIDSSKELQSRADRSYYFYYYSDFYGRMLEDNK